ncbi:ACP S-malonyltransferase [Actinomadura miaoliensis]|uniref:Malonyl-CoA:ACP transacylase (MAT) domain-containing protein n=1 Tax=Actinomadura miaoliensis TaxID=430685 RepID=A0ABP7VA84_9ACTN
MSSLHSPSPPGSRPRDTLPDTPPDGRPGALPDDGWALLFPGTGAAGAPAVRALAGSGRAARRIVADVLDAVQEGLPRRWPSLRRVLLDDPASYRAAAATPGVPQLSDYATSVAVERVLRAGGAAPAFAVGQSFGEIAALVCAGAFTVTDGARLAVGAVRVLARHGHGGGMALLQAAPPSAETLIGRAGAAGQVVVACVNAPELTVVAGPEESLERVLDAARRQGVRAGRLAVPYLSHHPAMAAAGEEWYAMIRDVPRRPLELPVYSPVRGRAYSDGDDLHRAMADCMARPLRLPPVLRAVRDAGATVFVEAAPGDTLCQCVRLTLPRARTWAPLHERSHRRRPARATSPAASPATPASQTSPSSPGSSGGGAARVSPSDGIAARPATGPASPAAPAGAPAGGFGSRAGVRAAQSADSPSDA